MSNSKLSKFFSVFSDCLKGTSHVCIVGEQIIEVIELADPDPVSKAILASIVALMKASGPALLVLANACSDESAKIDAETQANLKALGLLKKDGSISSLVSDVVKQTVTVTKQ